MFFGLAEFACMQVETNWRSSKIELRDPEMAHAVSNIWI